MIDAHEVIPNVWQGSKPPQGRRLADAGFDVLVLAAQEHQPQSKRFPGVRVYHVPLEDRLEPLTQAEADLIDLAAQQAAMHAAVGRQVLITCAMGINRSGIITARTVQILTGASAEQAIRQVKRRRKPMALINPTFVRHLLLR